MHRDMSYRKPVPIYIPSPPPSPLQQSYSPSALDPEIPPLPDDWRLVIDKVAIPHTPEAASVRPGSIQFHHHFSLLWPHEPLNAIWATPNLNTIDFPAGAPSPNDQEGPSFMVGSPTRPDRRRKRRLHQHYRPPTPPINAERKQINCSTAEFDDVIINEQSYGGYEEVLTRGCQMKAMKPGPMTVSSSCGTERTLVAYSSFNPSMTWSGGLATYFSTFDGISRISPILPMQRQDCELEKSGKPCDFPPKPTWNPWWQRMRTWGTSVKVKIASTFNFCC